MTLFEWVKQQVSIVDVVGQYVRLVRLGNYFKASCMFHSETDASFTVSPDKGIFYCFGCHATGDAIAFIAKVEHVGQAEAVQMIIARMGLTVPDALKKNFSAQDEQEKKDYFSACLFFEDWARQQLLKAAHAIKYLETRGVDRALSDSFALGYMPSGHEAVNGLLRAAHAKGILAKHLIEIGVLLQSATSSYHSPYEERIIFPIHDTVGRCVGFGGRIFREGDVRPKYYNSRESDYFLKRHLLFGYHKAKHFFQKTERAFLVEGYLDCILVAGSGVGEVVATLGTACTPDQLKLLSRFVRKVFVIYDADKAGQKAMLRLAELCWEVNLELFVISLPSGKDPAAFVQAGGSIAPLCDSAVDIFTFFVTSVSADFFKKTLSEKMEIGQRLAGVIARVNNRFKQDLLLQQAARALQVQETSLRDLVMMVKESPSHFNEQAQTAVSSASEAQAMDPALRNLRNVQERIVGAVLSDYQKNDLLSFVDERFDRFFDSDIAAVIAHLRKQDFSVWNSERFNAFLLDLPEEQRTWVMQASLMYDTSLSRIEFRGLLSSFCRQKWRFMISALKAGAGDGQVAADYESMKRLMSAFSGIKE